MARPNFFCNTEAINLLLDLEFSGDYHDIAITMDLIELPYYFIYFADAESYTMKVMQRNDVYDHDEDGIEKAHLVVNKETGNGEGSASEALKDHMSVFYHACQSLSHYCEEHHLEQLCADFDPEQEGVLLYVEDGSLKHRVVSGKERPEMMCMTLFGEMVMCRPYMDDFWERSMRESMSFEDKLEAAEDGDEDCMHEVAMAYLNGDEDEDIEQNPEKALYWMEKAAEEGHALSAFNTGLFYARGYGAKSDLAKAVEWMDKAAEAGDEDAEGFAAKCRAALADRLAAEKGDAAAQGRLAGFYMQIANCVSTCEPDDYFEESFKWAQKAAEQGDGEGLWTLALAYEHGRGVASDNRLAFATYEKAVLAGYARAFNSLGCYYVRGEVAEKNMKMGFELILRGTFLGDGEAMANLGHCYQFGNGCMGNMKKAIVWYKKSLELIPNDELERKTRVFESLLGTMDNDLYEGEDSTRALTAEEQAFLNRIDAILPEDVKAALQNPDAVFEGVSFSGSMAEDDEEEYNEDEEDEEDEDEDDLDLSGLPAGYMEALEAATEADDYEAELADDGILPDLPYPDEDEINLSPESYPRIAYMAAQGDERALEILRKIEEANGVG